MKLLANENFPLRSVLYLRSKGFDIRSIGLDDPSMEDKRVMSTAINEDRTILTFDRDYGELIFKHHYKPPKGVIYLRIDKYSAEEPGLLIEEWLSKSEINFEYALTVLDGTSIRQRRYV